jgi:ABC-type multidrug transport system ATPase subunit
MLEIKNLHAKVEGREILRSIDLRVNAGEVHAIMGPNGSGKSTLAQVLAGRESHEVTAGEVRYEARICSPWRRRSGRSPASFWRSSIRSRSPASATSISCARR